MRLAVVHCPQWPVVVAGGPGGGAAGGAGSAALDEPVAVVRANRVVARSRAAAAAGVHTGQRRRDAQRHCPDIRLVAHDPARDARAFARVADAVADLVPRLELTRPGVLTFATRGPSRYFGGDEAMARRVGAVVAEVLGDALAAAGRLGIGVADGRFAAGVAARVAGHASDASGDPAPLVVPPGESAAFLAPRPLQWLVDVGGVGAERVDLLRRLGVRRLGELAALPEPDVLARFGRDGIDAQRMAAGCDDRPVGTEAPPSGSVFVQQFDTPLEQLDAVVFSGRALAERLVGALGANGRVCTQLAVVAETEHGECTERLWSRPTGFSAAAVVERIRWQLDGWAQAGADAGATPTAGVVRLVLEPTEVRADEGTQLGLWGGRTQADEWAQRAATRLAGLVGDEQVVVAEWRGGRQPGDLYRWVPASLSSALEAGAPAVGGAGGARGVTAATPPWPGQLPAPSPAVVHAEPRPIVVTDADGGGVTVSGRGAVSAVPVEVRPAEGGAAEPIVGWAGPWLLEERWWDLARHRRQARFQVLTAAGRAYLVVVEQQRWWLVGEYC